MWVVVSFKFSCTTIATDRSAKLLPHIASIIYALGFERREKGFCAEIMKSGDYNRQFCSTHKNLHTMKYLEQGIELETWKKIQLRQQAKSWTT
jgi:hypothetical protein